MSFVSGKCDFLDHLCMEVMHDNDNSKVSDLLECFEEFKRKTGGVIHQHKKIKIEKWFGKEQFNFIKKHCKCFDYDCLTPVGKKVKLSDYSFSYYNKIYDYKELNKKGIYITVDIKFNTLLDLVPYFPYLVAISSKSDDSEYVILSDRSYVEEHNDDMIKSCYESESSDFYRKELSDLTLKICENYFLYDLENRTKTIKVDNLFRPLGDLAKGINDNDYLIEVDDEIDYMHDLEYVWEDNNIKPHWCAPKGVNNAIRLDKTDVDSLLKEDIESGNLMIKYVAKPKNGFPRGKF